MIIGLNFQEILFNSNFIGSEGAAIIFITIWMSLVLHNFISKFFTSLDSINCSSYSANFLPMQDLDPIANGKLACLINIHLLSLSQRSGQNSMGFSKYFPSLPVLQMDMIMRELLGILQPEMLDSVGRNLVRKGATGQSRRVSLTTFLTQLDSG